MLSVYTLLKMNKTSNILCAEEDSLRSVAEFPVSVSDMSTWLGFLCYLWACKKFCMKQWGITLNDEKYDEKVGNLYSCCLN